MSKKFQNLQTYDSILATLFSTDGGYSWQDSADLVMTFDLPFPLPSVSFTQLTDPALAWDDAGNVFLVGLAGSNPPQFDTLGLVAYKSIDGGQGWGSPSLIHHGGADDKPWAAGDGNPNSPFHGRIYVVNTWVGTGIGYPVEYPGSAVIVDDGLFPEINVAANGDIYKVWTVPGEIRMAVSRDGGATFQRPVSPATGIGRLG